MRTRYLLLSILLLPLLAAADQASLEIRVKAAYLYKFCQYVEWPETAFDTPSSPLIIGVSSHDEIFDELQRLVVNRQIKNRPIQVRRTDTGDNLKGIHVLYLGGKKNVALNALAERAAQLPILTVAEQDMRRIPRIIDFIISDDRIRFDVQLDRAQQVGLHLSAELLAVARAVNHPDSRLQ